MHWVTTRVVETMTTTTLRRVGSQRQRQPAMVVAAAGSQ
jgi:hypothetical protein